MERGELGNAHARDHPGGADGAGALTDLDRIGAAIGDKFNAGPTGDIAGNNSQLREGFAEGLGHFADA